MPYKNEAKRKAFYKRKGAERRASFMALGLNSKGKVRKGPALERKPNVSGDLLDQIALADPKISEGRI